MSSLPPLWKHQKDCIEQAKNKNYFGIFFQVGCGKSRTVLDIYRQKCANENRLLKTLIVSPVITLPNWRNEILKYSKIQDKDIIILKGTGHERYDQFIEAVGSNRDAKIVILNYEALLIDKVYKACVWYEFECIIADESQRIKSPTSKRTKQLLNLGKKAKYRYILSGSPVLQGPMDLFSQFQFLDNGKTFEPVGNNFFAFKNHFFVNVNAMRPPPANWPEWKLRSGALETISDKIKEVSMSVEKKDCLDLPEYVRKTIQVELSPIQRRHYNEMRKNYVTFLNDKACTASLAITKALRLQQITSGFIQTEDGEPVQFEENPRLDALKEVLEELVIDGQQKCIVWCCFKENYKQIRTLLSDMKIAYTEVHGEISTKNKQEAIDSFCNNENVKVILGNQSALGVGVNLVEAGYAIYYSRNFSLEHDLQSEGRNFRGGSEKLHTKVTRIDIMATGTIDELVLESLANKKEVGEKLLRDVSRF